MNILKISPIDNIGNKNEAITVVDEKIVATDRINERIKQEALKVVNDLKSKEIIFL